MKNQYFLELNSYGFVLRYDSLKEAKEAIEHLKKHALSMEDEKIECVITEEDYNEKGEAQSYFTYYDEIDISKNREDFNKNFK